MFTPVRHATRIRVDDAGLNYSEKILQKALEQNENLTAYCEVVTSGSSIGANASSTIVYPWTSVTSETFDTTKGPLLKAAWFCLTGPNEVSPTGQSAYYGAAGTLRMQTSSSTNMKITSVSGINYLGAHFDDLKTTGIFSYRVFDTASAVYITNIWVDGASGVSITYRNASGSTRSIDVAGMVVAWS